MAGQNRSAQYHGANVEDHGGKVRLSQEQPRKPQQSGGGFHAPAGLVIGIGVALMVIGILGGEDQSEMIMGGLPMVGFGIFLAIGNKANRSKTAQRDSSPSSQAEQQRRRAEQQRQQQLRAKERSSLGSSSTYREHYPHKEQPQKPIDWDRYQETVGPTKKELLDQAKRLLDAGLMEKDEYLAKCREIKQS